jgi:hypothetical protein
VRLTQTSGKTMAHVARELGFSTRRSINDVRNWLARIVLLSSKHQTLLYSACLYSNPYSNADEHQRKTRARYGQKRAFSSTGRTWANFSEQRMSSPPFGSAEYVLRTPLCLKQGYKRLEIFSPFSLYSNCTATRL